MKSIQSRTIAAYVRGNGGSTIPGTDMALAGVESLAGSEAASGVLVSSQDPGTYTPLFETDFESDTVGNLPANITTTDDLVSDEQAYSGTKSWKCDIASGDEGFGRWGGVIGFEDHVKGDEIWVRIRTYWPSGFDYDVDPINRLKFMRLRTYTSGGSHIGYNDLRIISLESSATAAIDYQYEGDSPIVVTNLGTKAEHGITFDQWETWEWYLKLDNVEPGSGGTGLTRVWKDGDLLGEVSARTLRNATDVCTSYYLFTNWNGGSPANQAMYVDDIKIASSRVAVPTARDANDNPFIGV